MKSCCGFTLIEIMLAVMIAAIIMLVAVPSLSGVFAEQRLHESYDRVIDLVHAAQRKAMADQKPCALEWTDTKISFVPEEAAAETDDSIDSDTAATPSPTVAPEDLPGVELEQGETCQIEFPAALVQPDKKQWKFWPTGTCEPARITYTGPSGTWIVDFNPLTVAPTFKRNAPK